ncbi:MAG: hypothetical protein WCT49_02400 [Candidatus Paceibacterota bacterium]|jgi:hypothetical protein|nr:hypothetical protein [Candidatus Paceibacterota bacterium]
MKAKIVETENKAIREWIIRHYYIFTIMAVVIGCAISPATGVATLFIVLPLHIIGEYFHWQDYGL